MESSKIADDEARRAAQHERIREKLEEDVHARIEREATSSSSSTG